ncbi:MAG: DUF2281 domain-containing protein [Ardenticatenaceae bacterium]|nr:DUF2281 domain-containing protein [Ardenticatenaceae bacterium]
MPVADKIHQRVVGLPEPLQNEVLDFVEFLWSKTKSDKQKKELRPYGLAAGEFVVPDDFDDPLPEEIIAAFEGQ